MCWSYSSWGGSSGVALNPTARRADQYIQLHWSYCLARISSERRHDTESVFDPIGLSWARASNSDGKGTEGRIPLTVHHGLDLHHISTLYDHENRVAMLMLGMAGGDR